MGNYLDNPRTDTHVVEHGSIKDGIMISEGHMHGWRKTQEDAGFVNIKNIEELPGCSILGLFDGHGGPNVALYAARNFERVFREKLRLKVLPMVGKNNGVQRVTAPPAPDDFISSSDEARKMFDTQKNEYNENDDVFKMYEDEEKLLEANRAGRPTDKQKTFDHFNIKNKGFVKYDFDVEYYHIRQYLSGIVDHKQDDNDCIEAFEKMLKWKYENIHDSDNFLNIEENVIIEPEFIKTLFEDAFKAIDEEIKIKFFEWSDDHKSYKLYEKYKGWLVEEKKNERGEAAAGTTTIAGGSGDAAAATDDGYTSDSDRVLDRFFADSKAAAADEAAAGEARRAADEAEARRKADEAAAAEAKRAAVEATAGTMSDGSMPVVISDDLQGCTAEVVLFTPNHVITAHAGDSRTIHVNNNGGVNHSGEDHKPTKPSEVNRIEDAGGTVAPPGKNGRVQGLLAVSRGLGDFPFKSGTAAEHRADIARKDYTPEKQMVSSIPDVVILDKANIQFLATACDGVWDALSSNAAAAKIVAKLDELKKKNAQPPAASDPITPGWTEHRDLKSGKAYFHHAASKTTTWERPAENAFPTYLNKMSETVKYICEESQRLQSRDNISLLLTFFDEYQDRVPGGKNILKWDKAKVIAWVESFDMSSASHVESGADDDAVKSAITEIKNAFEGKNINGEQLLSPELKTIIGLKGEQAQLAEKILDDELKIIKIGPKGWNLDWFEAWFETVWLVNPEDGVVMSEPPEKTTRAKLLYINFIKHMCKHGAWKRSCKSVESYDKIGEIILGTKPAYIKTLVVKFAKKLVTDIPPAMKAIKEKVESIKNDARQKAHETVANMQDKDLSIVGKLTDQELVHWVLDENEKKQLVLYNEMVELLEFVDEWSPDGKEPLKGNVSRFVKRLEALQKGEYDWVEIKKKFYELKNSRKLQEERRLSDDTTRKTERAKAEVREAVARATEAAAAERAQFEEDRQAQSEAAVRDELAARRAAAQTQRDRLEAQLAAQAQSPEARMLRELERRLAAKRAPAAAASAASAAPKGRRTPAQFALGDAARALTQRGGKKSRKLRKRTKGGKKSRRRLRKRTTLKGAKRKRRRTRRRR